MQFSHHWRRRRTVNGYVSALYVRFELLLACPLGRLGRTCRLTHEKVVLFGIFRFRDFLSVAKEGNGPSARLYPMLQPKFHIDIVLNSCQRFYPAATREVIAIRNMRPVRDAENPR